MSVIIYTIGHSDHDPKTFIGLLKKHQIQALIDIRSQPYSSYVKHFNKETLKNFLAKDKIDYYYGGSYLGGRPSDDSVRREGKVDYELLRKSENYIKGMKVLKKLVALKKVVLMCSEEDPRRCHRSTLIVPDLLHSGYEVRNIRADGSFEIASAQPMQMEFPINDVKTDLESTTV